MMRILLFAFLTVWASCSMAQSLTGVNPNASQPGQYLSVTVSGQNTHFNQGSNTVWFGSGTLTGFVMNNPIATSATTVTGNVYIPHSTPLGLYDVNVNNSVDGTLSFANAFNVQLSNSQIIIVSPQNGAQGQSLNVTVGCQNAHFSSASNTQVWFSQGTYTMMGSNTMVYNQNNISTNLAIPTNAPTGLYETFVLNYTDGVFSKPNSFSVQPNSSSQVQIFPNVSKPGKHIDIYLHNFGMGNYTLNFTNGSSSFTANMSSLYYSVSIPTSVALGCYDLDVKDASGATIKSISCALELVGSTGASIDSVHHNVFNMDKAWIYGENTHFTHSSTDVELYSSIPFGGLNVYSFIAHSDTVLEVMGDFTLIAIKTVLEFPSGVKVTNAIDDTLTYPVTVYFVPSVGDDPQDFENVKVFPNPTHDIINIQSEEFLQEEINIQVFSTEGRMVFEKQYKNVASMSVSLSEFASGLYQIKVSSKSKSKSFSVLRQ